MMRWFFYNEMGYDPWDYRTPDSVGVGNSETCQIEVSRRLVQRAHLVVSFSPLKRADVDSYGVVWRHCKTATNFKLPGVWVVSRSPAFLDKLPPMPGRKVWFVSQDVEYGDALTKERLERIDRLLALCPVHAEYLTHRYPTAKDKIVVSSNGVRVDLAEEVEKEGIERNPFRIVHTSSPDRGLIPALAVFRRAREFEPRLGSRIRPNRRQPNQAFDYH
jgi:hypothetical protein